MLSLPILKTLRILDFTWVLAGPYATRILADFGAEVIKIQPLLPEADDEFSRGYYKTWNRNKLGITLNLNKPQGIKLAKRLVSISDAVIENFTPRVMANLGLDYPNLKKLKPDLIMLSMSAFGQTGPCRDYTGFGPTVQAFSGITHLTYSGKPPVGLGFSYADHVSGLYACLALLSALEYRHKTGKGQFIDVSQVEAMASLLGSAIVDYSQGKEVNPAGNSSTQAAPHGVYRSKGEDRWCAITVSTQEDWRRFKQTLGNPPWIKDRRFATLAGRLKNAQKLDVLIENWTKEHTAEEVMTLLQGRGVAAGVVQNAADLAHDPQLKSRKFFVKLNESTIDACPIRLNESPARYTNSAPIRGQDNDYVYGKLLGMSSNELAELKRQGII